MRTKVLQCLRVTAGAVLVSIASLTLFGGATGCADECTPEFCEDLVDDSSLTSNGRTYEKCLSCYSDGTCETVLIDDEGEVFFECEDEPGSSCTEASVNAQFAYCGVG